MSKITLSLQQLYELVWSQPLSVISRKYMHTEVSFRSLCINMCIPLPRDGHWENIKMGKEVIIPPLTSNYTGPASITLSVNDKKKEGKEIEKKMPTDQDSDSNFIEPINNNTIDKLVVSAGKALRKKENFTYDGMTRSPRGELGICVTYPLLDRSLTFMNLLIKEIRKRGHDIIVKEFATYVIVFKQELKIYCREKTKRVPSNDKWRSHVLEPSGLLLLKLDGLYGREWVDSINKKIEEHIPSMLNKFEEEAIRQNELQANAEKQRIQREEQQKIEKERKEKHDQEMEAFRILFHRAIRWEKSIILRKYIAELESMLLKDMPDSDNKRKYIDWARKKAEWYDPFINAEDEWLTDADLKVVELSNEKNGYPFEYPFLGSSDNGNRFFPSQNWYNR